MRSWARPCGPRTGLHAPRTRTLGRPQSLSSPGCRVLLWGPPVTCCPSLTERQSAASRLLLLGTTLAWMSLHGINFKGAIQGQRARAFSMLRGVTTLSRGFRALVQAWRGQRGWRPAFLRPCLAQPKR